MSTPAFTDLTPRLHGTELAEDLRSLVESLPDPKARGDATEHESAVDKVLRRFLRVLTRTSPPKEKKAAKRNKKDARNSSKGLLS